MLEMRPNCETCGKDLAPEAQDAVICSLECTFCLGCNHDACPNCGGVLTPRPTRSGKWLKKYPASETRVVKAT